SSLAVSAASSPRRNRPRPLGSAKSPRPSCNSSPPSPAPTPSTPLSSLLFWRAPRTWGSSRRASSMLPPRCARPTGPP
ncbi:hypothetical protein BN1708_019995, partial [Verticillium longisporum]